MCDLGQHQWHDDSYNKYTMSVWMVRCKVVAIVTHGRATHLYFPFQRRIIAYGKSMSEMGRHECRLSN